MRWKVNLLRDLEGLGDRSAVLNLHLTYFGSADRLDEVWRSVEAVDGDTIQRMARDYLIHGRQAVVTVVPSRP